MLAGAVFNTAGSFNQNISEWSTDKVVNMGASACRPALSPIAPPFPSHARALCHPPPFDAPCIVLPRTQGPAHTPGGRRGPGVDSYRALLPPAACA